MTNDPKELQALLRDVLPVLGRAPGREIEVYERVVRALKIDPAPTPYSAESGGVVMSADGAWVCNVEHRSREENEATAAFIAHACTHHAALLKLAHEGFRYAERVVVGSISGAPPASPVFFDLAAAVATLAAADPDRPLVRAGGSGG